MLMSAPVQIAKMAIPQSHALTLILTLVGNASLSSMFIKHFLSWKPTSTFSTAHSLRCAGFFVAQCKSPDLPPLVYLEGGGDYGRRGGMRCWRESRRRWACQGGALLRQDTSVTLCQTQGRGGEAGGKGDRAEAHGRGPGGLGRGARSRVLAAGSRPIRVSLRLLKRCPRVCLSVSVCVRVCACVCARARACGIDECR